MARSRQLGAIMFSDIVGYTAMMVKDEQKAFELLKKNRNMQRSTVDKYYGKQLKELDDSDRT